jgi:hypothetical protein
MIHQISEILKLLLFLSWHVFLLFSIASAKLFLFHLSLEIIGLQVIEHENDWKIISMVAKYNTTTNRELPCRRNKALRATNSPKPTQKHGNAPTTNMRTQTSPAELPRPPRVQAPRTSNLFFLRPVLITVMKNLCLFIPMTAKQICAAADRTIL